MRHNHLVPCQINTLLFAFLSRLSRGPSTTWVREHVALHSAPALRTALGLSRLRWAGAEDGTSSNVAFSCHQVLG